MRRRSVPSDDSPEEEKERELYMMEGGKEEAGKKRKRGEREKEEEKETLGNISPRYFVDHIFSIVNLLEKCVYIFSIGDEILSEILSVALVVVENCRVVSSITK